MKAKCGGVDCEAVGKAPISGSIRAQGRGNADGVKDAWHSKDAEQGNMDGWSARDTEQE
jgi:hypothetical protein